MPRRVAEAALSRLRTSQSRQPYHRITEFLSPTAADEVLSDLIHRRDEFTSLTGDRNFLRLPSPLDAVPKFSDRVEAVLPHVQQLFSVDLTEPEIELYVHAYNDGTHFGAHIDAHGGANWRRRISCVYFLHRRPRRFDGGKLVIYDARGKAHPVEPEHNSAVFFPSSLLHEVLPVACPSKDFDDSRFAINVWVC